MLDMPHAQLTRMIWIDARLVGRGTLNRADLMEAFGISVAQAATDLRRYNAAVNPGRLAYDRKAKVYRIASGSKPAFTTRIRLNVFHTVDIVREVQASRSKGSAHDAL